MLNPLTKTVFRRFFGLNRVNDEPLRSIGGKTRTVDVGTESDVGGNEVSVKVHVDAGGDRGSADFLEGFGV